MPSAFIYLQFGLEVTKSTEEFMIMPLKIKKAYNRNFTPVYTKNNVFQGSDKPKLSSAVWVSLHITSFHFETVCRKDYKKSQGME